VAPLTPRQDVVVAVDGGGSKTDVVVAEAVTGEVLGRQRGPGCSQHRLGPAEAVAVIDAAVRSALAAAGATPEQVRHTGCYLTAVDLPDEEVLLTGLVAATDWGAGSTTVANDLFALLRSGTAARDAAVVVCGTGINGAAVRADGAVARIPALGRCSGDWGGGFDLAAEILWLAARAEDGRGEPTRLRGALLQWTGYPSVRDLSVAVHRHQASPQAWQDRVPDLLAVAAAGDAAARGLVARQGEEIALLAAALVGQIGLTGESLPVVLGGGIAASGDPLLLRTVTTTLQDRAPGAYLVVPTRPPVLGALDLALERVRSG
jgi:N-acetylglucosamine kinase-like BadF-type ATPase